MTPTNTPESSTTSVQHTPGRWTAFGYEVVGEDGQRVALTSTPHRPHPEERANARLIAAAPDLLAAAVALWAAESQSLPAVDAWSELIDAIEQAQGRNS